MREAESEMARHERSDVNGRNLVLIGIAFAAFLVISGGVLWVIFRPPDPPFAAAKPEYAAIPDGLADPKAKLQAYFAGQHDELDAAHWLDDTHQYAKLPIEAAMRLLAEQRRPLAGGQGAGSADCPVVASASPRAAATTNCGARP